MTAVASDRQAPELPFSREARVKLLRCMIVSREVERVACELNPRWFPADGEEAAIVGAFFGLRPDDVIAAHYRGPFVAYYMRGADLAQAVDDTAAMVEEVEMQARELAATASSAAPTFNESPVQLWDGLVALSAWATRAVELVTSTRERWAGQGFGVAPR